MADFMSRVIYSALTLGSPMQRVPRKQWHEHCTEYIVTILGNNLCEHVNP